MGAQLNIKDREVADTLRAWAKQEGRSVTATLRDLVEREASRREVDRAKRLARMTAFADEVYASLPDDIRKMTSKEIMDSIYDDTSDDGFAR